MGGIDVIMLLASRGKTSKRELQVPMQCNYEGEGSARPCKFGFESCESCVTGHWNFSHGQA